MRLSFCLYHCDTALSLDASFSDCQVFTLLFRDCKEEEQLLLSLFSILPWACFPSGDGVRGIQTLQWAWDRDVSTWQELWGSEWRAGWLMKPSRKADVFAFMLKGNNNNNLRLMKSAALTALDNASHLPTDTKQSLQLCHHCFEREQPSFGHGCSVNPRPPSKPCLCHLKLHFPGSGALASCTPGYRYTTNSWPWCTQL